LPAMSAFDPPLSDEGVLDPLGMAPIADRLANTYADPMTARMRRIRFVSAMCLGALVAPRLEGVQAGARGDSPDLAFERMAVEALALDKSASAEIGIPGIAKAHAALAVGHRLNAGGYLKGPRVFGFHGVYRPFANALGLVDREGALLPAGRDLIEALERDHKLDGLLSGRAGTPGGEFLNWLAEETRKAFVAGQNTFAQRKTNFLPHLVALTRPAGMSRQERVSLRKALSTPPAFSRNESDANAFVETLGILRDHRFDSDNYEFDAVETVMRHASVNLAARMAAVQKFEDFAGDLLWAFDTYRWMSTTSPSSTPSLSAINESESLRQTAVGIRGKYASARLALERLAEVGSDPSLGQAFEREFSAFGDETLSPENLISAVIFRHGLVQRNKAPSGKRSWFDEVGGTWAVRHMYRVADEPERRESFVHPYRFIAMTSFLADTHG
jgi:hypothetical protein